MGPALLLVLLAMALVFLGYAVYGALLGLARMGGYLRRFWLWTEYRPGYGR